MRVSVFWLCCPTRAAAAQKKAPTNKGGEEKGAMANPDLEALAERCAWAGDYMNWKEQGTHLNEHKVGLVTLDQINTLRTKTSYLPREASLLEAKFVDIN